MGKYIGLVLPNAPNYSETFFISKIKGLQQAGHRVVVFTKASDRKFTLCTVKFAPKVEKDKKLKQSLKLIMGIISLFVKVPGRVLKFIQLNRAEGNGWKRTFEDIYLNQHILAENLDWLHFGFATMAVRKELLARAIGCKMAVSFRGYDIAFYPLKNPGCYNLLWKYVDKVHTISDDLYYLALKLDLPAHVEKQKITPAIRAENFIKNSSFQQIGDTVNICTIGRLHWKKGLDYTIDALAILDKAGVKFRYTVIGEGDMERYTFAAHQLGIAEKVFFAGKKSHEEVASILKETDIYLQCSVQEGFCNAALEAQAAGLLCIVSNAEGLPENVLHEKTGWVVPKRNAAAIATTIQKVLRLGHDQLNTIRLEASERVQRDFNLPQQIDKFIEFYN